MSDPKASGAPPHEGGPRLKIVPPGDTHERLVCPECNYIAYSNPKVVVGVVASYGDKILLCRRGIEPRKGYWTLPAGFMENGETMPEGAARETVEETGAIVTVGALLAIYQTPDKTRVMMIYRAEMASADVAPGIESLDAQLFSWNEMPWQDMAFPMVEKALQVWQKTKGLSDFQPEQGVLPQITPKRPPTKPPSL